MEIKWSVELVKELNDIVRFLKKNNIGEMLEAFAEYFIEKHKKYGDFEEYSMNFSNDLEDPSMISDGEYKLAFLCELINRKKKKKKYTVFDKENMIYLSLKYLIVYCIDKKLDIKNHKLTNKVYYLTSVLKNILNLDKTEKSDKIIFSINLTRSLISKKDKIDKNNDENYKKDKNYENYKNDENLYMMSSLISASENLNISILSNADIRNAAEIMETKRTLYVRFLLILAFEIMKFKNIDKKILLKNIDFYNYLEMTEVLMSPLTEAVVFLTFRKILKNKKMKK